MFLAYCTYAAFTLGKVCARLDSLEREMARLEQTSARAYHISPEEALQRLTAQDKRTPSSSPKMKQLLEDEADQRASSSGGSLKIGRTLRVAYDDWDLNDFHERARA